MVATAAEWKEHRRPQEGERVEYQVLRIGKECGQPWPTDVEVREILRKDPRARGTVYGTHYAIRFTHKQMVPTPVLLAETPGDAAQAEQREHNPFASPSMVTSSATLPKQGQAACDGEGVPLGQPAAGSLLKDPRRARKVVVEGHVSSTSDPAESPVKEQSMATPEAVQDGVTNASMCQRRESV